MSSRRARAAVRDPASLLDAASKYSIDEQTPIPAPLPYDVRNGVRLLCTAIEGPDGGDDLRDALARACERFIDALPTGWIVHRNPAAVVPTPRCFTPGTRPIRGPARRVRPRVRGEGGDAARGWNDADTGGG